MGVVKGVAEALGVEVRVAEASKTVSKAVEVADKTEAKETEVMVAVEVKGAPEVQDIPAIRLRDMQISLHLSPASGTGPSGSRHIFVWNQHHVPGRITGCQRVMQINEIQADLKEMRKIRFNLFMTYFTVTSKKTK